MKQLYTFPDDDYHVHYPSGLGIAKDTERRFYANVERVANFKRLLFFTYPDEQRIGDEVI